MSRLLLAKDGYEGLYIDGKLVAEGCPINEGTDRTVYFAGLANDYDLVMDDFVNMVEKEVDSPTLEGWQMFGSLPINLEVISFK